MRKHLRSSNFYFEKLTLLKSSTMLQSYLSSLNKEFNDYKRLAEKSFDQLSDEQLNYVPNPESNSIATIVKHLHGNMLSRWTDFLTTDGEKEWRQRDAEFEDKKLNSDELLKLWNEGWQCVFEALQKVNENNISSMITIRNQPLTIPGAFNRQLAHYSSHIGQILYIGKMIKGADWKNLSMPKKK